ncbi:uncharacterized protein LOC127450090 [Myxocyprinus asiaticus]|uniref:uncharacterized protein LOC127450090 n=1 Tax=Myxocyprinus asiaticus TaxID=70543 RepID=UPI00222142D9|nr:uncharacterized protein LOC127450090 [Myxocyprinus asiaticus]XP_051569814.1 uncharacterized protein LOC127450090 [Myxocyprinus asiaticus]XP_051569824.1 uncharacterized protein LOC127450090 [Myxocyprinus asiaticus]XP_051569837.1 uncharacterized protein LOC127450090 [Myxocyprinus asiaticus]XP_051569848.1 uncharacterized protein LOC127450090 [Myxocyprinus asiaticus]XP_051569860.1 uncharacterized protein LOC127450090 [Myxocyprinus asiaticus]XP_051569868.1 uncharacterized protein LOC127450090 [
MLMQKHILASVRHQDWFTAVDLKDAYFHVSILSRHRPFLRFAFESQAYQYKVLPFGLSLSPRVFTKVAEAALAPLREVGIRILNYLDDWLILAHSQDMLCAHRDLVLSHLSRLGLRVNWEKSKLLLVQSISFLGLELDSVSLMARLMNERAQSVLACLKAFKLKTCCSTETFSEAPGAYGILGGGHPARVDAYEAASALAPDLSPEMGMAPRDTLRGHHASLSPSFQPLDRPLISTGRCSSRTGLQARRGHNRCLQNGLGCLQRAHSRRPLDGSATALAHQLPCVVGNSAQPAEVTAVDPGQAGISSDRQHDNGSICQLPRQSALSLYVTTRPPSPPLESAALQVAASHSHPGQPQHYSGRAVTTDYPQGRVETPPSDGLADLESIQQAQVHLFTSQESSPLPALVRPDRGPPLHRCAGTQLAPWHVQICVSPSEPAYTPAVVDMITQVRAPSTRRMPLSGVCSLSGVLPIGKTPGDAQSDQCFPSCRRGWKGGCPLPP